MHRLHKLVGNGPHNLNKLKDSGYMQNCSFTNDPNYFPLTNVIPTVREIMLLTRTHSSSIRSDVPVTISQSLYVYYDFMSSGCTSISYSFSKHKTPGDKPRMDNVGTTTMPSQLIQNQ